MRRFLLLDQTTLLRVIQARMFNLAIAAFLAHRPQYFNDPQSRTFTEPSSLIYPIRGTRYRGQRRCSRLLTANLRDCLRN